MKNNPDIQMPTRSVFQCEKMAAVQFIASQRGYFEGVNVYLEQYCVNKSIF